MMGRRPRQTFDEDLFGRLWAECWPAEYMAAALDLEKSTITPHAARLRLPPRDIPKIKAARAAFKAGGLDPKVEARRLAGTPAPPRDQWERPPRSGDYDKDLFRTLFEACWPARLMADVFDVTESAIHYRAEALGLSARDTATVKAVGARVRENRSPVKSLAATVFASRRRGDPKPEGKPAGKPARRVAPANVSYPPGWSPSRDAALLQSDGTHAAIASLAETWGMETARVRARWHLLMRG